jgi:hypothetical protein
MFQRKERQTACKPGSVPPRSWSSGGMAIPLGRPLPSASCDRPERRRGGPPGIPANGDACRSYLVLLPVGFSVPPPLPAARCALTAPFHPCRAARSSATDRRCTFCGTFPGVAPAGRYPAPYLRGARTFLPPPEGGERPSGRLALGNWVPAGSVSRSVFIGSGLAAAPRPGMTTAKVI